jgi:amino acid adenylation domain-containing protein
VVSSALDEARAELLRQRLAGRRRSARRPVIPAADRSGRLPLSFGQERLWFLSQLAPDSTEYQVPLVVRLRGALDIDALRSAYWQVIGRNEILRTRYRLSDARPVQVIDPPRPAGIGVTDLSGVAGDARLEQAAELARRDITTPFDLSLVHPARIRVIKLADDDHILAITLHHIAADGWSIGIVMRELLEYYGAAIAGRPAALPPLPVQYADYAIWQRNRLAGDLLDRHLEYWRDQLAGLAPLQLPTDRPRGAVRDWAGGRAAITVPAAVADRLRELARQADTTLFVVTLTAFQLLLGRYAASRDVAVGTALTARNVPELQDLVGFFLDTVVLRARWDGDPTFAELLDVNRQTVLDGISHSEAPLQMLVDQSGGGRELSRTPLFQVMFDLVEAWPDTVHAHGLTIEPMDLLGSIAKHDLRLELAETGDGPLRGSLEYATALFDAATAGRMAGHYLRLLEAVAAGPGRPLSALEMMDEAERRWLLAQAKGASQPRSWVPVTEAVAGWARRAPDATAVTAGTARLSYAGLDARASQVAHLLLHRGLRPGSVVGVCLEREEDLLPVLLGVWRAGCAYVPLDPADPPDRLGHVLRDCGAALLVTGSEQLGRVPAGLATGLVLTDVDGPELDAQPATAPGGQVRPGDPAYLIYTSGSTGVPKGVLVSHGGLMNYLRWAADSYAAPGGHGAPLLSSIAFDLAVTTLYAPLLAGQPVHLLPPEFDLADLATELIAPLDAGRSYSFVKLTPAHLELICPRLSAAQAGKLAAHLVVGGEGFPSSLARRWRELAGPGGARQVNEYGPTEICVASVAGPADRDGAQALVPIGRPIPNTTAHILDDRLRPAPVGVTGELYIGGSQLAIGYHNMPRLTAQRFVADPYGEPGARLYRTGDLARRLPDGVIDFTGRADDQVKLRGYRIEPAEAAAALRRHPAVLDAAVAVRENKLVGYVVTGTAGRPADAELREFAGRAVPSYMVPAVLVTVPAIPLTGNGKVDYRALPAPGQDAAAAGRVAPRTPAEERLAAVFRQVLGLDEAGIHDDFFDLGGDSVSAVAVIGALRDDGMDVAVQDLFEHSTVAELAEVLTGRPALTADQHRVAPFELITAEDRAKVPPGVVDAYPLSMLQRGMLFEMLGGGDINYYHNASTYTIKDGQPFSLPALQAAAEVMVARQEMLRTSFDLVSFSTPLQLVHAAAHLPVGVQDLRALPPHDRDRVVRDYMAAEQRRLFDIASPPLFRLFVHVTSDEGWQITITECHPILEGWGYHLMLMDLIGWYRLIRDGRPVPGHQPLPIRYADFIAAEQRSLASAEECGYWRRIIETVPRFALPTGWAGGPGEPDEPFHLQIMFVDLAGDLRALAKLAGVPVKSVLHAAHLKVMSMLTAEPEFFTGLVCDTRPEATGADRLPGLFLNTVPFPFRLTARTWRELAADVFAQETELWPYRRYPVLAMQRELTRGGGHGGEPGRLIDVLFNYLDFHSVDTGQVDFGASIDDSYVEFGLATSVFAQGLLTIRFHPGAISRSNGERLAAMYRRVLRAMAADPDGDARASYLPAGEYERLVSEWNDTAVRQPPATLPELFAQQVAAAPNAVAVVTADGRQVSYADLDDRAGQLARHLRSLGIGPDSCVGLCLASSVELLVGVLGVAKAGGAYVPLDPGHPGGRLAFILSDTRATVVLTTAALRERLPAGGPAVICLDQDWPRIAASRGAGPAAVAPGNLAYVIYTSGSTGRPKGVLITHHGLVNYLRWAAGFYGLDELSGAPFLGSPAVDLPVTNYLLPLVSGRAVHLLGGEGDAMALAAFLAGPATSNLVKLTPAHLALLTGYLAGDAPVRTAGTVVAGGDQLTGPAAAAWRRIAPGARLVNEYGPTETVVGCAVFEVPAEVDDTRPVPVGKPIANTRIYLLNSGLHPVPIGVAGELYVAGAGLARGYLNDPAKTAAAFVADPFSPEPGARCYRTGDLARFRPDGQLEFLGRADDQIKFLGYRIEPGEIENSIITLPYVADAAVVARADPPASTRLVAYVVPAGDHPLDVAGLRESLSRTLPGYMVPAAVVPMARLPRTPAGKIDRNALPRPAATVTSSPGYRAPRNDVERVIAEVWAGVLGVERVGVEDRFAALGGNSLTAMRVSALLRSNHKIPVSARDVLGRSTVAELAEAASAALAAAARGGEDVPVYRKLTDGQVLGADGTLVWFRRTGTLPPLFCVHDTATLCFSDLAKELGEEWPVAAIQHPAMIDPAYAGLPIEELARVYGESIRAAAPAGPYRLLGWCSGVPVLWELARQLLAGGHQVTICLLDPKLGDPTGGGSLSSLASLRECEELTGRLRADPDGPDSLELRRKIMALLRSLFPEGVQAHDVRLDDVDEGWPEVVRAWREQEQARLDYRLEPLPAEVHLVASDEAVHNPGFFCDAMTYDGYLAIWRELAGGTLPVHRVPGWHDGMLRPPLVSQFARTVAGIFTASGRSA